MRELTMIRRNYGLSLRAGRVQELMAEVEFTTDPETLRDWMVSDAHDRGADWINTAPAEDVRDAFEVWQAMNQGER